MPKISESFGGKWLKAVDIGRRGMKGTIDEVTQEEVGQGNDRKNRLVVWIKGEDKGLVLNVTNGNDLASLYGDDTDGWRGKKIALKTERVTYQGRSVDGIRIDMTSLYTPVDNRRSSSQDAESHRPLPGQRNLPMPDDDTPTRKPAPALTQEEADEEIPW